MRTGHMRLPFQPQHAAPALALSMPDELRIRDRSTILARHLYSEQGTAFADQQVRSHPTISSLTSGDQQAEQMGSGAVSKQQGQLSGPESTASASKYAC